MGDVRYTTPFIFYRHHLSMQLGIDRLLSDNRLINHLRTRRVALLGHPASVTSNLVHSMDALQASGVKLSAAFGPQHGMRGDKQDNMVETDDAIDPAYRIPVFSLYGKTRRLTSDMLETFDLLVIDIQDVGCRIYTFLTTLFYVLEDCSASGKEIWILDRPNPAGREIEGSTLNPGQESFVGAAPVPMRHGLTLAEAANWYIQHKQLDIEFKIVKMLDYQPTGAPGYGWPLNELCWVNPSPNMATLNAARAYAGTVLLEGTTLSEGRGTTRPLEIMGAPELNAKEILRAMYQTAPNWLRGCLIRQCWFEPTFNKYNGELCDGLQIHTDYSAYDPTAFKPYRIVALFLKMIRKRHPHYKIWRNFAYEYERDRLAIDVIDGGKGLREWVDDSSAEYGDFETRLSKDEIMWTTESKEYHLY